MGTTLLICILIAILLVAGAAYQSIGTSADARRFPPPGQLVDAGGFRLHLHEAGAGDGPVVVLEAGIAASSLSWSLVHPEVASFARVVRYDRAGLGWSDAAPGPRTAEKSARELAALLANAGITGPFVLVGHSFGGYVARLFAAKFPERVAGLVLVDSPSTSDWIPLRAEEKRRLQGGAFFSRIGAVLASLGLVRFCLARLSSGSARLSVLVTRSFGRSALTVVGRLVGEVQKLPVDVWPQVQAHWCQPKSFRSMASHLSHLPDSAAHVEAAGPFGNIPLLVLTASKPSLERLAAQQKSGGTLPARKACRGGEKRPLDSPRRPGTRRGGDS